MKLVTINIQDRSYDESDEEIDVLFVVEEVKHAMKHQ